MLNLYWKIFLGFWFTGLVLGGGAIFVSQQLRQDIAEEIRGLSPSELANRTAFIIRRLPEDINDWKARLEEQDIKFYTDATPANSLAASKLPSAISEVFNHLDTQPSLERSTLTRLTIGKLEQSADGRIVKYVLDMPSITLFRLRQFSEHFVVQLLLALAISAGACFVIARYLTRNLKQISEASRALAGGDLSARIRVTNRALKDELTILSEDFNAMADSVQAGIENQKRLVRDISHELRSPLARLQIALELARQNTPAGAVPGNNAQGDNTLSNNTTSNSTVNENAQAAALERIATEADRLNEMIGQLLAMPDQNARLDDAIDLGELLCTIIENNQIEANKKHVSFHFRRDTASADGEALVRANAGQLYSALENIVRNAIHYTDTGSQVNILLEQTAPPVSASGNLMRKSHTADAKFRISIADSGPGVPEEDLESIFEPFYRVDRARNRKTGGYGIGLAIVHRVISAHHGQVRATNAQRGLVVEVLLPKIIAS